MVLLQINSGIGDAILALPMIHELAIRGYEVHALVNPYTATIARLCPDIEKYYVIDYAMNGITKAVSIIRRLNKVSFAYFIGALPSNLIRDAFLPVFLNIPFRIKHESPHKETYRNYDFLFNRLARLDATINNTEGNLALLSMLDDKAEVTERKHSIVVPDDTVEKAKDRLRGQGWLETRVLVGMHPGCKETWAFKRWPTEKYADLIARLAENKNLQIALFGGPEEKKLADEISKGSRTRLLNLVGQSSLEETIAAISLCKMFVSNDSALMHVATIFDIPVIALFGSTNEMATGPYGTTHVVIKKTDVNDISVEEVYDRASKLLDTIQAFSVRSPSVLRTR